MEFTWADITRWINENWDVCPLYMFTLILYVALLKAKQTDRKIMLRILSFCVTCIKQLAGENDSNECNCFICKKFHQNNKLIWWNVKHILQKVEQFNLHRTFYYGKKIVIWLTAVTLSTNNARLWTLYILPLIKAKISLRSLGKIWVQLQFQ